MFNQKNKLKSPKEINTNLKLNYDFKLYKMIKFFKMKHK